jgi:hypothetical protein
MKTLPFTALFAVLILTSSYVSTKIDVAPAGAFKKFQLQHKGSDVSLTWAVSSVNVVAFAVERSYDGTHFEAIGSMDCKGTVLHKYNDIDVTPGTVYYRVAAVRADESVESSAVATTRIVRHS